MLDPDEREDDRDWGIGRALATGRDRRESHGRDDAVGRVDGSNGTDTVDTIETKARIDTIDAKQATGMERR